MKILFKILFGAGSGVLVSFGQNALSSSLGPLAAALGFAPYWKSLDGLPSKTVYTLSFLWFWAVHLVQLSWMTDTTYHGGCIWIVYLLLTALIGTQFAFLTKKIQSAASLGSVSVLGLSGLWVLMEWIRYYFLSGFPFNPVGLSLSCHPFSLQFVSLLGILGLSFWVVMTNLLALRLFRKSRSFSYLVQWGVVAFFPYVFGACHIAFHESASKKNRAPPYTILAFQTGLKPSEKYRLQNRIKEFIFPVRQWKNALEEIAPYVNGKPDLVLFPEAVFPFGFNQYLYDTKMMQDLVAFHLGPEVRQSFPPEIPPFGNGKKVSNAYPMQTLANFLGTQVVAGLDIEESEGLYNSAFSFEPGKLPERYDKRVLLPLVEYLPFNLLRKISESYGIHGFFNRGEEAKLLGELRVAPSICYEELFPHLIRESALLNPNLFVNLSNDGWFPSSSLPEQHFTQGLIRAAENGRPLVRSCCTGITAAVDGMGRVVAKIEGRQKGVLYTTLSSYRYNTLFSEIGQMPLIAFSLLFLLLSEKRERAVLKRG